MTVREGSLEAPKRHPIDWKNPDYYDEDKLDAELHRVFDICHGCRRCVNLCGAFPKLFDLIDNGPTGEMDGVDPVKYGDVVDQCYLCDMCFMTKCPYVPPHQWNVDFPHLMLRAKAIKHVNGETTFRDKTLSSTDKLGTFAGIPVVTQTVNWVNKQPAMRKLLEARLGVDKKAWLPEFATKKFKSAAEQSAEAPVKDGERTPGKVAIFSTCYVDYNEPGIGHDLIKILKHNEIPYVVVKPSACCGMPKLEMGDLDAVEQLMVKNIPQLVSLAEQGYAIVTPIPSCTLMFKQEIPLMFSERSDVRKVREAMYDPFEYFVERNRDGLLKKDFKTPLGKVSYHIACHLRVQNIGQKTRETLQLVPGTTVNSVERCSGHAGTWGVKKEFHASAMKIGRPVFRTMGQNDPDYISSDCQLAGHHIEQGMTESGGTKAKLAHPISLLRIAYGL